MEGLAPILPLMGIVLVFWLLVIRPNARRERERRAMHSQLAVGDAVVLTSGFFGTIARLDDDRADVELAPGTTVSVALGAIGGLDPAVERPAADPHDGRRPGAPDLTKNHPNDATASTPESEES